MSLPPSEAFHLEIIIKHVSNLSLLSFAPFLLLSLACSDPEYKLKSANQTPTALNNALTNSHEISRNIMDERKAYIKGVRNENEIIVFYHCLTLSSSANGVGGFKRNPCCFQRVKCVV